MKSFLTLIRAWRQVFAIAALLFSLPVQAGLLADLYAQALRSEPTWLAALADREAALENAPQLRSSILPKISLDGHYARLRDDTQSSRFPGYEPQTLYANVWQYGVSLEQPLLDWAAFARLQQISASLALAELNLVDERAQLLQRVAIRYFAWLGALDDLGLAREQTQAISEQLRETKAREQTGYATAAELQQLIAAHDAATADELLAASRLRAAREAVLEVAGDAPRFPQPLSAQFTTAAPEPGAPQHWVDQALDNNVSLRLAQYQLELDRQELAVEKSDHYPQLQLELEHRWLDNEDLQLGREAESSSALLRLKIPLFSGGATSARVAAASKKFDANRARLQAQRRGIVRETRNAYDGVVTGIQRLRAAQQAVTSSQAALVAVEGGWESGIQTGSDLLVARKNLFEARRDAAAARYAYLLSTLNLRQLAGELGYEDLLELDNRLVH